MKPNPFDELAKAMALSVTRRAAVKKFGFGLTTLALAALGLTNKAEAVKGGGKGEGVRCKTTSQCKPGLICLRTAPLPDGSYTYTCRPPSGDGGICNTAADCMPVLLFLRFLPVFRYLPSTQWPRWSLQYHCELPTEFGLSV